MSSGSDTPRRSSNEESVRPTRGLMRDAPSQVGRLEEKQLIVNVGLPRTGSTSLCEAVRQLGFRALHVWYAGEHDPELLERLRCGRGPGVEELSQYDLVTDTPFYALRETFERNFPQSRLICTTRPCEDWIESMIAHRSAGGAFLAREYGLPGPPHLRNHATALRRAWIRHHDEVASGLLTLDLRGADEERWDLLISLLRVTEENALRCRAMPWPQLNQRRGPA